MKTNQSKAKHENVGSRNMKWGILGGMLAKLTHFSRSEKDACIVKHLASHTLHKSFLDVLNLWKPTCATAFLRLLTSNKTVKLTKFSEYSFNICKSSLHTDTILIQNLPQYNE